MGCPCLERMTQNKCKLKAHELSGRLLLFFVLMVADFDHLLSDIATFTLVTTGKIILPHC